MAAAIRGGIASAAWSRLRALGFTPPELASVVGVSEKTIARKKDGDTTLTVAEGDRTVRLVQLALEAARVRRARQSGYGEAWLQSGRSLVLGVPSAIVKAERNYVINPDSPRMKALRVLSKIEEFVFDARLLTRR
jgi:RES domain-containing protein